MVTEKHIWIFPNPQRDASTHPWVVWEFENPMDRGVNKLASELDISAPMRSFSLPGPDEKPKDGFCCIGTITWNGTRATISPTHQMVLNAA